MPEGLEHIGDSAFENCQALPAITIPSTVAYVGSKAFYNCLSAATVNLGGIDNIEFLAIRFSILPNGTICPMIF